MQNKVPGKRYQNEEGGEDERGWRSGEEWILDRAMEDEKR